MIADVGRAGHDATADLSYRVSPDARRGRCRGVGVGLAVAVAVGVGLAVGDGPRLHQVDEDILLRATADDRPPVGPAADGRRPEGAVVVVVALVSRLHDPSGWAGSPL